MGRPREFDVDEAVERAAAAFLRGGYAGTSVADLMAAMGIEKGSLYKAFGDKRGLFLEALDRYLTAGQEATRSTLAAHPDACEAVRAWISGVVGGSSCPRRGPGCLAVAATAELAPLDPEVRDRLRDHWDRLEALLAATLRDGQAAGRVRPDRAPEDLARLLVHVIAGAAVFARQGDGDPGALVDTLVALLGP